LTNRFFCLILLGILTIIRVFNMSDKINKNIITAIDKIFAIQRLHFWEIGKEDKLSPIQIQFIEYISKNPVDFCTISNLSKEYDLKKPTVSDSVSSLIDKGYLKKFRDNKDARVFYFTLTEKIRSKLSDFEKRYDKLNAVLNTLPLEEKEILSKVLLKIISEYYSDGSIQSAKICLTCSNFVRNPANSDMPFYCEFTKEFMKYIDLKAHCRFHENNRL